MDETLLRDILNRLNDMPTRFEFNNLLIELKEYVTKSEYTAEIRRLNEKVESMGSNSTRNSNDIEDFKRNRLPAWMVWVGPVCIGGAIQLVVWYTSLHNH